MPAVVQHLARPGRLARRRLRRRDAVALDTGDAARPRSASPARARPTPSCDRRSPPGVTIEIESRTEAAAPRRAPARARHPPARRRPRQPRLRGQGLGHADGRRPAAVRRRRRAGARAARRARRGTTSTSLGFHVFAGSQNLSAEILVRGAAQDRRARPASSPSTCPAPVRYVNLGGGFGIPYFEKDEPLDLAAVGGEPRRAASTDGSRRRCPDATVVIELGRYIVGEAGVYVTRVVDRKESRGAATSSSTAACTTSSPPPATSARSSAATTRSPSATRAHRRARPRPVTVVGCLCTPLDLLGDKVELPARRGRRPRRRLPGRRLRPHRQPHRLPRPPAHRRRCSSDTSPQTRSTDTLPEVVEVLVPHPRHRGPRRLDHPRHRGSSASSPSSTRSAWSSWRRPSRTASTSSIDDEDFTGEVFESVGTLTDFIDARRTGG